jgi:hypothetical protein
MIDALRLANLVVQIQDEFFETADLALSAQAVGAHFGVDEHTCTSVLDFLAEANVLAKRPDGTYVRFVRKEHGPSAVEAATPKMPLPMPRSIAFITSRDLARMSYPSRRVA